jgi:peptidyl-prolyl cis-trans isomerase SurA
VRRRRRLAGPALAVSLALAAPGCAIPSWVPFVGADKPRAAKASAAAPQPAAVQPEAQSPATLLAANTARLPAADDVMDRVICVVNNDAITLYELEEAEAHYLYENKEEPPVGDARKALRERLLGNIIENRIQLQQAERDKIVVDDVEINEQLQDIVKKVNAKSQAEFEEALKAQGLTLDGVKKRIRDQIMVQRLTRRKVALRVSITEQEIDKYLEENRSKLEVGLSFAARHILFLPDSGQGEDGWTAAKRKADEVYGLLREGQDFGALAKKYSEDPSSKDGGNLGALKRGELAPEIEEAILKLQPGQYSAPFRSPVGYHLFKLDSKETLTGEAYVQTRNQVRDILYRQKYDARLQEWIAEMKQRAIIDVRL